MDELDANKQNEPTAREILERVDKQGQAIDSTLQSLQRIHSSLEEAAKEERDSEYNLLGEPPLTAPVPASTPTAAAPDMFTDPEGYQRFQEERQRARDAAYEAKIRIMEDKLNKLPETVREEASRVLEVRQAYADFMAQHPYFQNERGRRFVGFTFAEVSHRAKAEGWDDDVPRMKNELAQACVDGLKDLSDKMHAHETAVATGGPGRFLPTSPSQPPALSYEEEVKATEEELRRIEQESMLPHEQFKPAAP